MAKTTYASQRVDAATSAVIYAEKLCVHMFKITANENQFPKAFRYSLSDSIRKSCLLICRFMYIGVFSNPKTVDDYDIVFECQKEIVEEIMGFQSLLSIAGRVAKLKNPEYIAILFDDFIVHFNNWKKSTKRKYSKLAKMEKMSPEELAQYKYERKMSYLAWQARRVARDEDGFIILQKKKKKNIQDAEVAEPAA